jgi:hypothetical protein
MAFSRVGPACAGGGSGKERVSMGPPVHAGWTGILGDIEASTAERLRELLDLAEDGARGQIPFPERRHISAITLRLQAQQEAAVLEWARWAREQIAGWSSTADPDGWDSGASMADLAAATRRFLDAVPPSVPSQAGLIPPPNSWYDIS